MLSQWNIKEIKINEHPSWSMSFSLSLKDGTIYYSDFLIFQDVIPIIKNNLQFLLGFKSENLTLHEHLEYFL